MRCKFKVGDIVRVKYSSTCNRKNVTREVGRIKLVPCGEHPYYHVDLFYVSTFDYNENFCENEIELVTDNEILDKIMVEEL